MISIVFEEILYDQYTAIKENSHEKFLYVGKKKLMVDELAIGGEGFIKHVKLKYQSIHNGQTLPKISKRKSF